MQKLSELLNIKVTKENSLIIYHPIFKDKKVYWECSTGYWIKREFDYNGNEIYWETSDGNWDKREYDSNGKEIYYEDSYGKIIDNRVIELTLDQIAEKFGISVNQLKIKK